MRGRERRATQKKYVGVGGGRASRLRSRPNCPRGGRLIWENLESSSADPQSWFTDSFVVDILWHFIHLDNKILFNKCSCGMPVQKVRYWHKISVPVSVQYKSHHLTNKLSHGWLNLPLSRAR